MRVGFLSGKIACSWLGFGSAPGTNHRWQQPRRWSEDWGWHRGAQLGHWQQTGVEEEHSGKRQGGGGAQLERGTRLEPVAERQGEGESGPEAGDLAWERRAQQKQPGTVAHAWRHSVHSRVVGQQRGSKQAQVGSVGKGQPGLAAVSWWHRN